MNPSWKLKENAKLKYVDCNFQKNCFFSNVPKNYKMPLNGTRSYLEKDIPKIVESSLTFKALGNIL